MEVTEVNLNTSDAALKERYRRLFEKTPGAFIQQSIDWAEVIAPLGPDEPIFLICQDGNEDLAGLPLYLFRNKLGPILTSVPQAGPLGGIFYKEGLTHSQISALYRALLEKAVSLAERFDCLALTVITHPFQDDLDLCEQYLKPHFVLENFTQFIPLDREVRRQPSAKQRLRHAEAQGLAADFCKDAEELAIWYRIHEKRHREIGAMPIHTQLFKNIFERLVPRDKARLILVKHRGEIISGGFYIYHRHVGDVHMLSMDRAYQRFYPNFLCTDFSIRWMRERGVKIYNWQSSPARGSGVYEFKRAWGSIDRPYYFVTKLLVDAQKIEAIGAKRLQEAYAGHYVVPFAAFGEGFRKKYFTKGATSHDTGKQAGAVRICG